MTANDNVQPVTRRSGSQRRQRVYKIGVSCNADEFVVIEHNARAAGLSRSGYLRACATGTPGPRAQRVPHVNAEALARATAALNKVGSNLNQLSRALNSASPITAKECGEVLALVRQSVTAILDTVARKERL